MLITKKSSQVVASRDWAFDYDISFFLEVPTHSIMDLLPRLVHPYEVRPGVSLLSFGLHRFEAGNLEGTLPVFVEANCGILVQPRLSIGLPPPRFAIYVLYIASNTNAFVQHATNVDKMPVYEASNLQWRISPDGQRVEAWDDFGPMFTLQNTQPNPVYTTGDFHAQIFSLPDGKSLYHTRIQWQGQMSENQHKSSGFGKFYNHPSLKGLEIDEQNQNCYMQMFTPACAKGNMTFWEPTKLY